MLKLSNAVLALVILMSIMENLHPGAFSLSYTSVTQGYVFLLSFLTFDRSSFLPLSSFWAIVTCSFVETSIWKLVLSAPVIYVSMSALEALWTLFDLLQYLGFVTGVSGLLLLTSRLLFFMMFGSESLFNQVSGCVGLVIPLVIGFRHAFPYKELVNLNKILPAVLHEFLPARGLIQSRHLPFLCLSTQCVLSFIFPSTFPEWPLALISYFASWFYIRYLMHFSYANLRGDHSSEFTLSLLFPKLIRPALDRVSIVVYEVLVKVSGGRLELRPVEKVSLTVPTTLYSPADAAAATAALEVIAPVTAEDRAKFEERRAKALKFLDENIAALIGRKDSGANADTVKLIETQHAIGGMTEAEINEV
jgi:hypothetical protein